MNDVLDFDKVLAQGGEFGKYQKTFFLLLCFPAIFTASTTLINTFNLAVPEFRCQIPDCDNNNSSHYQDAFRPNGFANFTIPLEEVDGHWQYAQCWMRPRKGQQTCSKDNFHQNVRTSCQDYVYDRTHFKQTAVTEWNLVCGDKWAIPLIESIFFIGTLISAPLFGWTADKWGRRTTLLVTLSGWVLTGIAWSFSVNYTMYAVVELFVSSFQIGVFQTAFILGVELVGKRYRVFCGVAIEYFFVMGEVYLVIGAYFLRGDWRPLVLVMTCPVALAVFYWPLLPESVRWLIATNKEEAAKKESQRLARWNNAETFSLNECFKRNEGATTDQAPLGLWTYVKNPRMLGRLANVSYCWIVVAMVFYGLSMNASTLVKGDPYLNFLLVSLVEIPGYTASYFTMKHWGRRKSVSICLMVGGAACILDGILDKVMPDDNMPAVDVAIFLIGKLGVTSAFATIYLYTSEMLPTPVRTAALGLSSMAGRLGAISAPYISSLGTWLPLAVFGVNSFVSGALILLLPETLGKELPETLEDAIHLAHPPPHAATVSEEFAESDAVVDVNDRGPLIANSDILS